MKITELRIGNLVQASWKKTTHQVSCHTFVEINEFDHCYNPIPLTEEWLERFGLKKIISQGSIFKLGEFHIQNFGPLGFYECRNHVKIVYVHLLQNLYFALTGEELTLKEEVKP